MTCPSAQQHVVVDDKNKWHTFADIQLRPRQREHRRIYYYQEVVEYPHWICMEVVVVVVVSMHSYWVGEPAGHRRPNHCCRCDVIVRNNDGRFSTTRSNTNYPIEQSIGDVVSNTTC
jgi:hypothetical protein